MNKGWIGAIATFIGGLGILLAFRKYIGRAMILLVLFSGVAWLAPLWLTHLDKEAAREDAREMRAEQARKEAIEEQKARLKAEQDKRESDERVAAIVENARLEAERLATLRAQKAEETQRAKFIAQAEEDRRKAAEFELKKAEEERAHIDAQNKAAQLEADKKLAAKEEDRKIQEQRLTEMKANAARYIVRCNVPAPVKPQLGLFTTVGHFKIVAKTSSILQNGILTNTVVTDIVTPPEHMSKVSMWKSRIETSIAVATSGANCIGTNGMQYVHSFVFNY